MNKAKTIAVCGLCSAVAVVCLLCCALPGISWFALLLAAGASIAVSVPILLNQKNLIFSLLTYVAAGVIGVFVGMQNIVYIVPVVAFCMPTAIVKTYGESMRTVRAHSHEEAVAPFEDGEEATTVTVTTAESKPRLSAAVRWALYYLLLEVGLVLTILVFRAVTPDVFVNLVSTPLFWALIVAAQAAAPLFVWLLTGCMRALVKILRKIGV